MTVSTMASNSSSHGSPYKLDPDQTLKASQALLRHIHAETQRLQDSSSKKNLLVDDNGSEDDGNENGNVPVWLNLTTKQHIVDKSRLKPSKIRVPHSLNTSSETNICLFTCDPQRAVKNIVADPSFPPDLASQITRIIGFTKLKDRYKSFEQRRALLSEHNIFLADERIITRLPATLGKVFYKGTAKRPIPVRLADQQRDDAKDSNTGLREKDTKKVGAKPAGSPAAVAKEIQKAIDAVPVNLRPGITVTTRVGLASFTAKNLAENIAAVVDGLIEKHVVRGWRNVKAIHIKSPTSIAVPIWLADELWMDDAHVEEKTGDEIEGKETEERKRKRNPAPSTGPQAGARKKPKASKTTDNLKKQPVSDSNAPRKLKLAEQKARAFQSDGVVV